LRQLAERAEQRLVVHATRGRDEHEAVHAFRCGVRDLETDGAAHRVPHEDGLVDPGRVEDGHKCRGQSRDVEDPVMSFASSVAGQVRDQVDAPLGQPACRGHEVLAGDRETMEVDDRWTCRAGACAAAAVDGLPVDLHALRRPRDIGRHG
jgi:hypothetical protein